MSKKQLARLLTGLVAVLVMTAWAAASEVEPPMAQQKTKIDTIHGMEMVDKYFWLRDRDNPEVIDYLKAENAYAKDVMAHTQQLQDSLFKEMKSRIKETDLSVPVRHGDWLYYTREEEGKQYKIYCRKKSEDAPEQVLLDVNELAEGKGYMLLGAFEVNPDHNMLAYAYDTSGNEEYTVRIKNLETGDLYPDVIVATAGDVVWANDGKTLFYTTQDDTYRPYRLYRHELGSADADPLIYEEPDAAYYLSLQKTRDDKYVLMDLSSAVTSEVHYLDANTPTGEFKIISPREHNVEYNVNHHDTSFYILTNADDARNFKLVKAPVSNPSRENWEELIGHSRDVMLQRIQMFADYMAIYERRNGLETITVMNMNTGDTYEIPFEEAAYSVSPGENPEFNSDVLRFSYQSMVTPRSVYDFNMVDRTRKLLKQREVLGGYNPDDYKTERIFATARDGAQVPISLVYKKALFRKDGTNPLYLGGYGAYGISSDPYFSTVRLSLLDRGFVVAIAHIRGGGEMGRYWYEDGKYLKKKNTFYDFIDCAGYLQSQQYSSANRTVIAGGSAGGLLIGAVLNMRPDICAVAVASVPFVDLINTMLDETIPLTVTEWEEWGNPNQKDYFDYMLSYSPYDNVKAQDYPNILITAGLNDPRVAYWEPAKWAAKLRATKTDDNLLVLKTVMEGGHFGKSGRYSQLHEIAYEYAFIFDRLGMTD
jgi:oligopeptidase B